MSTSSKAIYSVILNILLSGFWKVSPQILTLETYSEHLYKIWYENSFTISLEIKYVSYLHLKYIFENVTV